MTYIILFIMSINSPVAVRSTNFLEKGQRMMNEDTFNGEVRKFLKKVGVTSQNELEKAVREALVEGTVAGTERLKARMKLEVEGVNLDLTIEGEIALS